MFEPDVLRTFGWDRAFVTVLDEVPAEEAVAVVAHAPGEGWTARRVELAPGGGAGKTEDAESCARRDGRVYLLGSQFGKKAGPLAASRSWAARIGEDALAAALEGEKAELTIARLRFGVHRAVNDALAAAAVELLPLGPRTRDAYIDATIAHGAKEEKRWAGRVRSGDHPLNVEGMEFRADGRALLGLRYPVTADGRALLVELDDVDALFDDPEAIPRCSSVWILEGTGTAEAPAGVRALHHRGGDRFDAVVGDLDASGKGATVLEDHPHGGTARSRHVSFALPLLAGGGPVAAETVHDFGDVRRVEGVVVDADARHAHYVLDEEGHVALRTLPLG